MISKKPSLTFLKKNLSLIILSGIVAIAFNGIAGAATIGSFDEFQIKELKETYISTLPPKDSSPIASKNIEKDAFKNIIIDNTVPNILFKNETYVIQGHVTNNENNEDKVTAFLDYTDTDNNDQSMRFEGKIKNNAFSIPLHVKQVGTFYIGIVLGDSGESMMKEISIIETSNSAQGKAKATTAKNKISLTYNPDTDTTYLQWKQMGGNIMYRVNFQQGNKSVQYVARQKMESLPLRFSDFRNFKPGDVTITIASKDASSSGSWKNGVSQKVRIDYHGFRSIESNSITIQGKVPSIMNDLSSITIKGVTKVDAEDQGYVTLPNGKTEEVAIKSNHSDGEGTIPAKSTIEFSYTPTTTGRYIVEINDAMGLAIVNTPVYINTNTPLIPDYDDLSKELKQTKKPIELKKDRKKIVDMINAVRVGIGLSPVTLDTDLTKIAQDHTNDMIDRDFYAHVNPDGESPKDRRIRAGYMAEVGENLANAETITGAMVGLLRSPGHRSNILDENWTKVGVGIGTDKNGYLLITEEFSGEALTPDQADEIKNNLMISFNENRKKESIAQLVEDDTLTQIASDWSWRFTDPDLEKSDMDFTTSDGTSLRQTVEDKTDKAVQMFVYQTNSTKDLYEKIAEASGVKDAQWKDVGLGIAVSSLGELKITMLLSK